MAGPTLDPRRQEGLPIPAPEATVSRPEPVPTPPTQNPVTREQPPASHEVPVTVQPPTVPSAETLPQLDAIPDPALDEQAHLDRFERDVETAARLLEIGDMASGVETVFTQAMTEHPVDS